MKLRFWDFYTAQQAWAWKTEKERLGWVVSIPAFNESNGTWYVTSNFGAWAQ